MSPTPSQLAELPAELAQAEDELGKLEVAFEAAAARVASGDDRAALRELVDRVSEVRYTWALDQCERLGIEEEDDDQS